MKYNININQLVLAETELDLIDAAILDYLITFCNSKNEKIEKRRVDGLTPVDYDHLISEMPLLKINSRGALTPRIKKIESAGFIIVKRVNNQNNFICLTSKVDELFTKLNSSVHETKQLKPKAVHNGEPIIILDNNYTKEYSLPAWLDKQCWDRWVTYRKSIRKKMSEDTIKSQLAFLEKNKDFYKEIIEQSIFHGWTGLFVVKGGQKKETTLAYRNKDQDSMLDKINKKVVTANV